MHSNDGKEFLMRHAIAILALAASSQVAPALAEGVVDQGTVVELFTSQGCSSCPPADEILAELADREHVIALALHVDYWDYIGWADDLADPMFTARQRAYAKAWDARNVYTPQMVVAGVTEFVGSHHVTALDSVASHVLDGDPVTVGLSRSGDLLTIDAQAVGAVPARAVVQVVRYTPEVVRAIERGENAGRTVVYRNVVTDWSVAGTWDTDRPLALDVTVQGDAPVVVIVQDGANGPVLGAARLR